MDYIDHYQETLACVIEAYYHTPYSQRSDLRHAPLRRAISRASKSNHSDVKEALHIAAQYLVSEDKEVEDKEAELLEVILSVNETPRYLSMVRSLVEMIMYAYEVTKDSQRKVLINLPKELSALVPKVAEQDVKSYMKMKGFDMAIVKEWFQ